MPHSYRPLRRRVALNPRILLGKGGLPCSLLVASSCAWWQQDAVETEGGQLHVICRWRALRVACVCMSLASVLVSYLASIASVFQAAFVTGMFCCGDMELARRAA